MILPEEDRRGQVQWDGGFRWFRSANIVDLWNYRSPAEKQRIIEHFWRKRREFTARFGRGWQ
jgi:hypothetical protein